MRRLASSDAGMSVKKTGIVAVGSSVILDAGDQTGVLRKKESLVTEMMIVRTEGVAIKRDYV